MINFSRAFSLDFIFEPGLGSMSESFARFFYLAFGALLIIGLIAHLVMRKREKNIATHKIRLLQKLSTYLLTVGIVGFVLILIRQQRIYFLSMPVFLYLWFVASLVWLFFIIRWSKKRLPQIKEEKQKKQQKEKYLP